MRDDEGTVSGPAWWLQPNAAWQRLTNGPVYPPNEADRRDVSLFGLALPSRATVAIVAVTALILLDQARILTRAMPDAGATGIAPVALQRLILFGLVPVVIIVAGFRDDPRRYGLRLGDWRWGAGLLVVGLVVMTPIILGLATLPSFREFYVATPAPLGARLAGNLIELIPAEFLLRGFLMFALWRRIGPVALVVSLVPFVLTHLGKPDIELWSTFVGGSVFAWLDWRTGSILWSALGHVYVLTLMLVAVGGAT